MSSAWGPHLVLIRFSTKLNIEIITFLGIRIVMNHIPRNLGDKVMWIFPYQTPYKLNFTLGLKKKKKHTSKLIQLSSLINEFYIEFVYIVIISKISIQHMWIFVYIVINEFFFCQIFYLLSYVPEIYFLYIYIFLGYV